MMVLNAYLFCFNFFFHLCSLLYLATLIYIHYAPFEEGTSNFYFQN